MRLLTLYPNHSIDSPKVGVDLDTVLWVEYKQEGMVIKCPILNR